MILSHDFSFEDEKGKWHKGGVSLDTEDFFVLCHDKDVDSNKFTLRDIYQILSWQAEQYSLVEQSRRGAVNASAQAKLKVLENKINIALNEKYE